MKKARNLILIVVGVLACVCIGIALASNGTKPASVVPTPVVATKTAATAATDIPTAVIQATDIPATEVPTVEQPTYVEVGSQGKEHFIVIDSKYNTDKETLRSLSNTICGSQDVCIVIFWNDKSLAATVLPLTDEQVNAEVAWYNRNKNSGNDELLLCKNGNCN